LCSETNIAKGRELVRALNSALGSDFGQFLVQRPAADSAGTGAGSMPVSSSDLASRGRARERYMREYKDAVAAYTKAANRAMTQAQRFPAPAAPAAATVGKGGGMSVGSGMGGGFPEKRAGGADDSDLMMSMQVVDLTQSLVQEREQNIDELVTTVMAINEMYKDLSTLAEAQGESLDQIDLNVIDAHGQTESGVQQLEQAASYQKRYGKWILILLAVLVLVGGGIGAYFAIKNR
jgi:hypothetical protein